MFILVPLQYNSQGNGQRKEWKAPEEYREIRRKRAPDLRRLPGKAAARPTTENNVSLEEVEQKSRYPRLAHS